MKLRQNGTVSFLIKLAVFQARGAAYMYLFDSKKGILRPKTGLVFKLML
jgi:hypothetical protein